MSKENKIPEREALSIASIENNFTYHKPFGSRQERYERIRALGKELAYEFSFSCPASKELSLAMTNLETSIMWANAAISALKDDMTNDLFGMTKAEAIKKGVCIDCKQPAMSGCFSDLDVREYKISGLCGRCFNQITGGGDE